MKKQPAIIILGLAAVFLSMLTSACDAGSSTNPLAGTSWQLVAYGGTPVIEGTTVTATFEAVEVGGQVCNSYGGAYTVKGDQLSIGPIAMTEMYCVEPEGIMEQESAYLQLLNEAQSYAIVDNQLTITCSNGETLLLEPTE